MKNYKIKILPSASEEILEAKRFYEARRRGFGKIFSTAINNEFERITTNPFLFKKNENDFFEIPMSRFQHLIIYSVIDDFIIIVTVFHTSQNPNNKPK